MATVFETRLIGNIGKDAVLREYENGMKAIQFPVAHNKVWHDRRTNETNRKTVWVLCTIWKRENSNFDLLEILKKGTMVEVFGTPVARGTNTEKGIRTEIRLTVDRINVLRNAAQHCENETNEKEGADSGDITDSFDENFD